MNDPRDEGPGSEDVPDWERIPEQDRVPDADWEELVAGLNSEAGFVPEMSAEEIRERLAEDEEWHAPEPEQVGWRKAPPLFVLAVVGVLGGIGTLLVCAIFFRPIPGYLVLVLLAVILVSGLLLFLNLPDERGTEGDGARV
ncbi:hypothetical protein GCM10022261_31100 [Brevibacterium daeguense]|uniref:DUF3040 family protein n=1 Tax=Brevibacterium daeguense TaxID=909936 RepID=A0ABP8ENJ1_9MICO|nr:hypothetical protein [Brevibacterium daeguense]